VSMSPSALIQLLEDVRAGSLDIEAAAAKLGEPAIGDLGFATLDLHRRERCGFPEVIFAEGKTAAWVEAAIRRMGEAGQDCFVTRLSTDQAAYLASHFPQAEQDRLARTFWLPAPGDKPTLVGRVLVVTAGTSDLPVAQEAAVTARVMGANAEVIADVGVAG